MKDVIGRRLAIECSRLGFTGAKAAEAAGCSRRTWVNYESGDTTPDAVMLNRLDKLGFDVLFIVTGRRIRRVVGVKSLKHSID
nr:helix-turn-helix transcriptional regulator [Pseudomonas sp. NFPP33]AGH89265.1 putative transcriptional regulator [uncultured bacterium]